MVHDDRILRNLGCSALSFTGNEAPPEAHGYLTVTSTGAVKIHNYEETKRQLIPAFNADNYEANFCELFNATRPIKQTWRDTLRMGARQNSVGEIKTAADLDKLPKGIRLKAVFIPATHEPAYIRWGNPWTMLDAAPGDRHDHLWCEGDPVLPTRQGYLEVIDGKLQFFSSTAKKAQPFFGT